jgi:ribose/xylose/arabinose/galactoside ABC-type transport system permease subunit
MKSNGEDHQGFFYFDLLIRSGLSGFMYYYGRVALIIAGLWWCKVVIGRLPSDIREFKESDYSGKIPIVVIWLLTVCIIFWLVSFIIRIISAWSPFF